MLFGQLDSKWDQQQLHYMLKVLYLKSYLNNLYNLLRNSLKKYITLYIQMGIYHIGYQLICSMLN